jgi:hypothetical protein
MTDYIMSECKKVYMLKEGYSAHDFAVHMALRLVLEFKEDAVGCPGDMWCEEIDCDVGSIKNFEDIDMEHITYCMTDKVVPRLQKIIGGVITYKMERMEEGKFRMGIYVDATYDFADLYDEETDDYIHGLFC